MKPAELGRSPIRWAGSKRKLLPQLKSLAPENFERYVEPFCGSLCLFVALKPKKALVGDINEELIHFYKLMRKNAQKIAELVHAQSTDEDTYYQLRATDPSSLAPEERAARFLYLNRFCFNGVYRTNRKGQFNVPRGKHMGSIPTVEELAAFGGLVRRARLLTVDFSKLLKNTGTGDFIYLDPPYAGRGVRDRGEYGVGTFKEIDLQRLKESVEAASTRGAKVMISYADIPQIREIFSAWHTTTIEVNRNVSGFAKGRTRVSELILRNYH